MAKISLMVIAIFLLLVAPVVAGDPLDANDGTTRVSSVSEFLCEDFFTWPECKPCLTQCLFAIAVDEALGEWDF